MTPVSRRAFTAAATLSLVTGCGGGGGGGADVKAEPDASTPSTPSRNSPAAKPGSPPVRLRIPAIGVDTPVIVLGLAADGTVEVPPITDHDRAGWYRYSPVPGRTGPSVFLGHVTVGRYGDGVFRRLARLRAGDRVVARLEDGTEPEFTVTRVRTVAKADFPTEEVYGDVERPELRLITCGGPRTGAEYRDNVIVFAERAGDRR
ncbi:class F sortase [Streptomyces sp. NPDC090106]|uniref:class F sortase n=1 Tax=Streptomyces sp. NPDC090106 TaxID=3365946 RepID=UPI00383025E0